MSQQGADDNKSREPLRITDMLSSNDKLGLENSMQNTTLFQTAKTSMDGDGSLNQGVFPATLSKRVSDAM